jgi:hypothetical protein
MLVFDPEGKVTVCTESARVVDSVFVLLNVRTGLMFEDGEGRVGLFRTQGLANSYLETHLDFELWTVNEVYAGQVSVFLNKPHVCLPESYGVHDGVHQSQVPE